VKFLERPAVFRLIVLCVVYVENFRLNRTVSFCFQITKFEQGRVKKIVTGVVDWFASWGMVFAMEMEKDQSSRIQSEITNSSTFWFILKITLVIF
jgi:hypothetical protein